MGRESLGVCPRWLERPAAALDEDGVLAVTEEVLPARLESEAEWTFEDC